MARSRKYSPELLERGARVVVESRRPIAQVARDLGLPAETRRRYVRQLEADAGLRPDLPTAAEREEIKRLRRENYELRHPRSPPSTANEASRDARQYVGRWSLSRSLNGPNRPPRAESLLS